MEKPIHLSLAELEAGLAFILQSPKESGVLELIISRPGVDQRQVMEEATLDPGEGLVGDDWMARGSWRTPDKSPHPHMQIAIMNSRVIALITGTKERWALAGDQLYLDLDLSTTNLPHGTQLGIGDALLEITPQPHTGCGKFAERFGSDAVMFVNGHEYKDLNLRGVYARVVDGGDIRTGDEVKKIPLAES
jgi:hypothetical protein